MSSKMSVSEQLRFFAVHTSCHGIPHIVTAQRFFIKIFWLVLVVISSICVIVYVAQLYQKFQSHPVIVQSQIKFEELPFPAVTICNLNPIRKSQVDLVPQLKELLSACDLKPDPNTPVVTAADFCTTARNTYRIMFPKSGQPAS